MHLSPPPRPRHAGISRVGILTTALLGLVWVGIPAWAVATRGDAIRHGHPIYPVMLAVAAVLGVALLVRSLVRLRTRRREPSPLPTPPTHPTPRPPVSGRRTALRAVGWFLAVLVTALAAVVLVFGRPHGATDVAVAAMAGTDTVTVTPDATSITLTPRESSGTGVVFQPGARVDARAYVPILTRIAEQGHTVVIVEQPLGVSILAQGATIAAMDEHPAVPRWLVAGHSLGGVAAARTAASGDPRVVGLVFWASYADTSTRTGVVPTLSVYGTNDGLIAPSEAVPQEPPPGTRYVAADGATHTSFSDYGTQADDGVETVPHEVAQQRIVEPTLAFIRQVEAAGR